MQADITCASNGVLKGDAVFCKTPTRVLAVDSPLKKKKDILLGVDFCCICSCPIAVNDVMKKLPGFDMNIPSLFFEEGNNRYCSSECKNKNHFKFHERTQKFFDRMLQMKRFLDLDDFALLVTAEEYCKILETAKDTKFSEQMGEVENDCDELIQECWCILRSEANISEKYKSNDIQLSISYFSSLYKLIRWNYVYVIEKSHPIIKYFSEKLLKLTDLELNSALSTLVDTFPDLDIKNDRDNSTTDTVKIWRSSARMVQAISSNSSEDDEFNALFSPITRKNINELRSRCFVFCEEVNTAHSCIPNCFMEESRMKSTSCSMSMSFLALHDIKKGQQLTVSRIQDRLDLESRSSKLQQIYGGNFSCNCCRCRCERYWEKRDQFKIYCDGDKPKSLGKTDFTFSEIKNIADLAMQHSNYKIAHDLYTMALTIQPVDGDLLHCRSASLLERGEFLEAQTSWKKAFDIVPSHKEIRLHVKKREAYESRAINDSIESEHLQTYTEDDYTTLIPSKCYVTKDSLPIISESECRQAIEWAETAAENSVEGWTTSRHYAVPTTDIPIHEIPPLLKWFNNVLRDRLRPLLASQFGEEEVGKNGEYVFIHDAFIVRYDSDQAQRHLPLHKDQSTHSFTIALNSRLEYEGGGTYVPSLGRAIRPSLGGAMSFRGDQLLHGGDPIVAGKRLIIVAFCYCSKPQEENCTKRDKKRIKLDSLFSQKIAETSSVSTSKSNDVGFSFGFNF